MASCDFAALLRFEQTSHYSWCLPATMEACQNYTNVLLLTRFFHFVSCLVCFCLILQRRFNIGVCKKDLTQEPREKFKYFILQTVVKYVNNMTVDMKYPKVFLHTVQ